LEIKKLDKTKIKKLMKKILIFKEICMSFFVEYLKIMVGVESDLGVGQKTDFLNQRYG